MHIEGLYPLDLPNDGKAYSTTQAIKFAMEELSHNAIGNLQQFLGASQEGVTLQEVYLSMQNFLTSLAGNMDILRLFLSATFQGASQVSKESAMVSSSLSTLRQQMQNPEGLLSSAMHQVNALLADVTHLNRVVMDQVAKTPISLSTYGVAFEKVNMHAVSDLNILLHQSADDIDPYMVSQLLGMVSIMSNLQICMTTPSLNYSNIQAYLKNIADDLALLPVNTADIASEMAAIRSAIVA